MREDNLESYLKGEKILDEKEFIESFKDSRPPVPIHHPSLVIPDRRYDWGAPAPDSSSSSYYIQPRLYKACKDYAKWYEDYQKHPDLSTRSIMEMTWQILYEEIQKTIRL